MVNNPDDRIFLRVILFCLAVLFLLGVLPR